jgi:hypothetical protein
MNTDRKLPAKAKLNTVRTCPHCRAFVRLVSIHGSVVWAHTPGQGSRCATIRANRAARELASHQEQP